MDMDTAWNRCPPNSECHVWYYFWFASIFIKHYWSAHRVGSKWFALKERKGMVDLPKSFTQVTVSTNNHQLILHWKSRSISNTFRTEKLTWLMVGIQIWTKWSASYMMLTSGCWWLYVGENFRVFVTFFEENFRQHYGQNVTNICKLSLKRFVSNIRHQHRFSRMAEISTTGCLIFSIYHFYTRVQRACS